MLAPQLALIQTFLAMAALALPFFAMVHGGEPRRESNPESSVIAGRLSGVKFKESGKHGDAKKEFSAAADGFDQAGLDPASAPEAAEAAAASRFQLAEYELLEFEKLKVSGSGAALESSFEALKTAAKGVQAAYDRVARYKVHEWIEAAHDRKGYVLEVFARAVLEAPVPPETVRMGEEAVAAYREQLHDQSSRSP